MRSVKGMTIGSPEFVATVKAAQIEAENTEAIEKVANSIDQIMRSDAQLTRKQKRDLHRIWRDIGEVLT